MAQRELQSGSYENAVARLRVDADKIRPSCPELYEILQSHKALKAPSLTDTKRPWGVIRFIHHDGTTHEFYSVINRMSGSRLSAFDSDAPGVDDNMAWVKSVFRDIRKKAKVLGYIGTKHFE